MNQGARQRLEFVVDFVIEPDKGNFHAYCPALKGLHVDGTTKEEALNNVKEATIVYIESLIKHGDPIPIGITKDITKGFTRPELTSSLLHLCHSYRHTEKVVVSSL